MYIACTCVHTLYIQVHALYMGTTCCMHIPVWYLPLHTLLYCLWRRYVQCYHTRIYHCVHTGIYLQNTSKMPTKICCWDNWLKHVSTLHILVYIKCIYKYIHCTWVPRIVCIYHYCICHCILSCTAFDVGMYNAIIQESTILYISVYTSKMPTKICCWDNWLKHVCTLHILVYIQCIYMYIQCIYMYIHCT